MHWILLSEVLLGGTRGSVTLALSLIYCFNLSPVLLAQLQLFVATRSHPFQEINPWSWLSENSRQPKGLKQSLYCKELERQGWSGIIHSERVPKGPAWPFIYCLGLCPVVLHSTLLAAAKGSLRSRCNPISFGFKTLPEPLSGCWDVCDQPGGPFGGSMWAGPNLFCSLRGRDTAHWLPELLHGAHPRTRGKGRLRLAWRCPGDAPDTSWALYVSGLCPGLTNKVSLAAVGEQKGDG